MRAVLIVLCGILAGCQSYGDRVMAFMDRNYDKSIAELTLQYGAPVFRIPRSNGQQSVGWIVGPGCEINIDFVRKPGTAGIFDDDWLARSGTIGGRCNRVV